MQRSVGLSLIGGAAGAFATLLVLRATRELGRTVYLVDVGGYGAVAVGAVWALVWTALAGFVVWQAHRRDVRVHWIALGAALLLAAAWGRTVLTAPRTWHGLPTLTANEPLQRRDGPVHAVNAQGFRGPAPLPPRPDLAVVGDSFVFGIGVADHEPLAARLDAALPSVSVANLGLPGTNLQSHVASATVAVDKLGASTVIVCVTWANDFAEWDVRREVAALGRPSALSLLATFVGTQAATTIAHLLRFDPGDGGYTPARLAALDEALAALDELSGRASVVVLLWRTADDAGLDAVFAKHPQIRRAAHPRWDDPVHFLDDGHPSAAGHAAALAAALPTIAAAAQAR